MQKERQNLRPRRVARQIVEVISDWIVSKARDPVLHSVVITHVEVTADLRLATLYFLTLAGKTAPDIALAALQKAAVPLKQTIARQLTLRCVPELRFRFDDIEQQARAIEQTLAALSPASIPPAEPKPTPSDDPETPG